MKRCFTLLLVIHLAFGLASFSEPARGRVRVDEKQVERIKQKAQAKLDELRAGAGFPGATVGFVLPDGEAASVSTGVSDLESKRPLKPTDLLLAGSIGKTFVAAVLMKLVQEKKLNLDEKIAPLFRYEKWITRLPNGGEITTRMLLNHTSGIPNHVDDENFLKALAANPDRPCKPAELLAYVLGKPPLFPAGKGFSYSDTNYILVGLLIEKLTGHTLYSEVTTQILKPYQLNHTFPQESRVMPGVVNGYSALPYVAGPQGRMIVDGKFTINPQCEWAGGGFASTAEDLARWAKILYEGKFLHQPYLAQMLKGVKTDEGVDYGLGVGIGESRWGASYGHDGLFPGYASDMEYFPQYKVAVAIQFNTDLPSQIKKDSSEYIDDMMQIIIGELTGKDFSKPEHKQITLDPKIYDAYAGRYELRQDFIITVTREGEHLMAQATGQPSFELFPESETNFFARVAEVSVIFVKDAGGQVTSLTISQNGQDYTAKRIR